MESLPLLTLAPLVIGLFLSQLLKIDLKTFQGVYLLLVAALTGLTFYTNGNIYTVLIIAGIGLLATVVLAAFKGKNVRTSTYALMTVGIGLFPWTLSFTASIAYSVVFILFAILIALRPKIKNPFKSYKV